MTPLLPSKDGFSSVGTRAIVVADNCDILLTLVSVSSDPSDYRLVDLPRVRGLSDSFSDSISIADNDRVFAAN